MHACMHADFRPDYGQLGRFRYFYPEVPIMALTATATEAVKQDIFRVRPPVCLCP